MYTACFEPADRRREKRRFALATVCVPREDPAAVALPARQIDSVRIVAEHDSGPGRIEPGERAAEIEPICPELVGAGYLQAADVGHLVPQESDAHRREPLNHAICQLGPVPSRTVVVVPENPEGRKTP